MIYDACPVLVLDDVQGELWQVSHALSMCGFPVKPHLIRSGKLDAPPPNPYSGVRLIFTDLHILGTGFTKPEMYIGALINVIQQAIQPSDYVIVFWSAYEHEADEAWGILMARMDPRYRPLGYFALPKSLAEDAMEDDDRDRITRQNKLRTDVMSGLRNFPQIEAILVWEAAANKAVAQTSNDLFGVLRKGELPVDGPNVRAMMARMTQEALGYPYAEVSATRGLTQALLPILQDRMERSAITELRQISEFLSIQDSNPIALPSPKLNPLLNDFFIHAEGDVSDSLDRGAVIRLSEDYLQRKGGFQAEAGTSDQDNWKLSLCREFANNWKRIEGTNDAVTTINRISVKNIFAIELSAVCDHAQDKSRSQRFLIAMFVPTADQKIFSQKANDSLYQTPEITLDGATGKLLISCRLFLTRRFGAAVEGTPLTRLRRDVIDELSHHYSTHMRRPGKIAFF